jgi:hypothetical protein
VRAVERRLLRQIGLVTAATGMAQAAAPRVTLTILRAEDSPTVRQCLATVGMFMVCTGGISVARPDDRAVALLTAAQKAGAATAVALGVRRGLFSPVALGVAGFDALSGLLAIDYARRLG